MPERQTANVIAVAASQNNRFWSISGQNGAALAK